MANGNGPGWAPNTEIPIGSPAAYGPSPAAQRRRLVSITAITVCVIVVIALSLYLFWPANNDCGEDSQCFIEQANGCLQASYVEKMDGGTTISYTTDKCGLTVTVTAVGATEPAELKTALEGKSMNCDISQGINQSMITFPPTTDNCTGSLADILKAAKIGLQLG